VGGDAEQPLRAALQYWRQEWEKRWQEMYRAGKADPILEQKVTPCVKALLWAAGRLNVARDQLLEAVAARPDDVPYRPLRLEALSGLASVPMTAEVASALEMAAQASDPAVRTMAAEALGRGEPARAAKLAEKLLSDAVSFGRIALHREVPLEKLLRSAASQVHSQGVVLRHLLHRKDLQGLIAVADNKSLPLATRMGAVEGLAALAQEDAEARLVQIAQAESNDEELRKAAWRGLRRSRRARKTTAKR
jgi:ParB family chromosome partitioning protein